MRGVLMSAPYEVTPKTYDAGCRGLRRDPGRTAGTYGERGVGARAQSGLPGRASADAGQRNAALSAGGGRTARRLERGLLLPDRQQQDAVRLLPRPRAVQEGAVGRREADDRAARGNVARSDRRNLTTEPGSVFRKPSALRPARPWSSWTCPRSRLPSHARPDPSSVAA